MAVIYTEHFAQFFDNNGDPLSGGKLFAYSAGTTTPKATYTTSDASIENANPIVLDAAGRATIFIEGSYRFDLFDTNDVLIKSTDNVTSFTSLNESGDPFFESFSGDGIQTIFTLSESLGNDSKDVLVYVDSGNANIATNGEFAADTGWTKGTGWTIGSGVATATGAISTALTQVSSSTLIENETYTLTYTVTRSAGGIIPSIGGRNGVERTASGTYSEVINAGSTQDIAFTGNAFTGTVDNIVIKRTVSIGYQVQSPSAFTLSGTDLTFNTAPASGTDNIYVFAPSKLLGAAAASAAASAASAATSEASAVEAAASAALAALVTKWRPAVEVATTANITLSGEQTIDGVLTSTDRVLVKDQSEASENGVYVSAAGAWSRATDADTWGELLNQVVPVTSGSANGGDNYACTIEEGGTLGVTDVTWTQIYIKDKWFGQWIDVASGATTNIGAQSSYKQNITGTETITSFGSSATSGDVVLIRFAAGLTLTHGANLILPNAANIKTSAGDTMIASYEGSGVWRVYSYQYAMASGTYTPTLTAVTNVSAVALVDAPFNYMRVGNHVTVSGGVAIDPTTTGPTVIGMSLPIASAFTQAGQCGGSGNAFGVAEDGGAIYADTSNARANMDFTASNTSSNNWYLSFTYRII